MQTHDEFWLLLHDIASSLDSDALTPKQKAGLLAEFWALYPSASARQLADEFRLVLAIFVELEPLMLRAAPE